MSFAVTMLIKTGSKSVRYFSGDVERETFCCFNFEYKTRLSSYDRRFTQIYREFPRKKKRAMSLGRIKQLCIAESSSYP